MTAVPSIDPAQFLNEQLSQASPDLMRDLLTTFVNALLSAQADAVWIAPGLVEGGLCRLGGCRGGGDVSVVGCFVLGGWDVSAVAVQA